MKRIQGRDYKNFASPISDKGPHELPYSGVYHNPGLTLEDTNKIHAYDIGGTLAKAHERDTKIKQLLGLPIDENIKSCLFSNPTMTKKISEAQEQGILSGAITIDTLDGTVAQLSKEKKKRNKILALTVGTYQMARSFLHGAKLEEYIDNLVTSEEAAHQLSIPANRKTAEMFISTYTKLAGKYGKGFSSYSDDSERDIKAALKAREILVQRYGQQAGFFPIYHVKPEASDNELREDSSGVIKIRSILEKPEE
ncbi:hypothetical protein ACFL0V_07470 [Nanoarchaeota archaeon]